MNKIILITCIIALLATFTFASEEYITGPTPDCKYNFAGGSTIDFSKVGTITGTYNNDVAYFNLCENVVDKCVDGKANICVPKKQASAQDLSFGSKTSTILPVSSYDPATKINKIVFANGEKQCYNLGYQPRQTNVLITCGKANAATFDIVEKTGVACQFDIAITLKCGGGDSDGLSGGALFLIIFFSVLAGYFIFGFLICKFALKKEGLDVIPQRAFWCCLIPAYIAGIKCVIGKITGKGGNRMNTTSDTYGATEEV